jgi:DNA (cytosine-5)-methyltransferase 1
MRKIIAMNKVTDVSVLTKNLKAVDFFCGAGGVTSGFRDAGIKVLAGIDFDPNCKKTYEKNNPGSKFIKKNIATYTPKNLQKRLSLDINDNDLIFVGCSPCQYYSTVNKGPKDKSAKGKLLLENFQQFVDYFKPGYIFIENVPGLKRDKESPLAKFKEFLEDNNYIFKDSVLNAKHFGVPQNRRRYVLLATRVSKVVHFPEEDKNILKTVKDAIGDTEQFPPIPAGHKDETLFIHSSARLTEKNLKRIRKTSHNGGSRKDWAKDADLQLECYKDYDGHGDVYGRMNWDRVSPAITTKFYSLSNGRYGHPEQDRALSLREGAVLQSFPTDYKFYISGQGNIARLIGNAVPPVLAKKIAESIIKSQ